jgi:hypothetical protein
MTRTHSQSPSVARRGPFMPFTIGKPRQEIVISLSLCTPACATAICALLTSALANTDR